MLNRVAKKIFNKMRYGITPDNRPSAYTGDMENDFRAIYEQCSEYTLTSVERMYALFKAVDYVVKNGIPGDIVECGVYKGGSAMLAALVLKKNKDTKRKIYLYDTFAGMSEPTDKDISHGGSSAKKKWKAMQKTGYNEWSFCPIETVRRNLAATGYPAEQLVFVKGKVEDTIPDVMPHEISILRLDTDWYESTYHELTHLFPRVSVKGVVIIDDYGHWKGAREATDEYFKKENSSILLNRIDYTGRIGIK